MLITPSFSSRRCWKSSSTSRRSAIPARPARRIGDRSSSACCWKKRSVTCTSSATSANSGSTCCTFGMGDANGCRLFEVGIRHPKHVRVDLTGPMRTGRVVRVRAGFGRATLSSPNGATSRIPRRAPPRRPGPIGRGPAILRTGWDRPSQAISHERWEGLPRKGGGCPGLQKQAHRPG